MSASPGQEKSRHCYSNLPDEQVSGVVTRAMGNSNKTVLESNGSKEGETVTRDFTITLVDCVQDAPKLIADSSSDRTPCGICGKVFKGVKGVKIHQTKSKTCKVAKESNFVDCSVGMPTGNSESLASPESHHSALPRQLQNDILKLSTIKSKSALLWPRMSDVQSWSKLDRAVKDQISSHLPSVDQVINNLELVVYEEAMRLFGAKEQQAPKPVSRRTRDIAKVRANLRELKKAYKRVSSDEERTGICSLVDEYRVRLKNLRQAECSRKRRWRRKNTRSRFFKDPYGVARSVLSPKVVSQPNVPQEELDRYLLPLSRDVQRDVPLGDLQGLPNLPEVKTCFNEKPLHRSLLNSIVKHKRNASRPGVNGIPYKVYKKCPNITNALFGIMKRVSQSGVVPLKWRISDGIFIPKVEKPDSKLLTDYRQIALGNVEGKLFWSMVSDRFYKYLVIDNPIIDTSCQKGSIQKMSGVWEHTSMVWSALQDCKSSRKSIAILWLDLANAYGSVPHQLIAFALRRYGVPERWIRLVLNYYDGLWSRSSTASSTSQWMRYEIGIFAGCTISVILFIAAFNIIIEFVGLCNLPRYQLSNGNSLPLLRAFMDDLSVMTVGVRNGVTACERVDTVLSWARMRT